jgi:hypothetical protein
MNKNSTENFLKRLDGSRHSVFVVAEFLHKKGYNISIPAFDYRPPNSNWEDHVDDGDMYIWKNSENKHRIDVKHYSHDFTCVSDYPYQTMLIADIRAVERASPFPLAYIILNKTCTNLGIAWSSKREHWRPKTFLARNTDMMVTSMECPIEYIDFRSVDD